MNERINLLALEASDPKTGWLDRQKFAELIIKDIYAYVDSMDTAQIISNGILRRYGVE
jgi:hypothetical protein